MTPPTIDHFIGQKYAIRMLRVALEAAWNDAKPLPHILLTGPPGLGKTTMAQILAREVGATLHERLAQVVNTPQLINGLLIQAEDRDVVFLDEIHELLPETQTLLYRAMEDRQVSITRHRRESMTLRIRDITVIGATTDEFRLLSPLRDRFKIVCPFTHYDESSLATIVHQRASRQGIELDIGVNEQIAAVSRGTPRLAIRLLDACHRYARSRGTNGVSLADLAETLAIEGIDDEGLNSTERSYLQFLAGKNGNTVRLADIEATTGLHRRTIQTVVEPYLIRQGLIERAVKGRNLTQAGRAYINRQSESTTAIEQEDA